MTTAERHLFETIHWSTMADAAAFKAMTDFLPKRAKDDPYHSGPQNLSRLRLMYELLRPKTVMEIGFNLGHSAVMWLELGVKDEVLSIQPELSAKAKQAAQAIYNRYPGRFTFRKTDSKQLLADPASLTGEIPDLLFIDGCHDHEWVLSDIEWGLQKGVRNFFMDDYDSHHGPGVIQAVADQRLVVKAVFGTMAWCTTRAGLELRHNPEEFFP